jgi:hypothetical protein
MDDILHEDESIKQDSQEESKAHLDRNAKNNLARTKGSKPLRTGVFCSTQSLSQANFE